MCVSTVVLSGERGQHLYFTLRKELVRKHPSPLSSDAFTRFGWDGSEVHNSEVCVCVCACVQLLARAGFLPILGTVTTKCAIKTGAVASVEHRRRESARAISPE